MYVPNLWCTDPWRLALDAPTGQPDGSLDAVVTTGAMRRSGDPEAMVREAGRCLKPGAPLVFVEDLSPSWGAATSGGGVMEALTGSAAAAALFEPPQYDDGWATLPLAPVAIGVAVRRGAASASTGGGAAASSSSSSGGGGTGGGGGKRSKGGKKDDFETSTGLSGKRGKRRK